MRDGAHLIHNRHLPTVRGWLSALSTAESEPPTAKEATTRELIDLRQHLEAIQRRCDLLAIFRQQFKAESGAGPTQEDLFEEVVPGSSDKPGFEATYGGGPPASKAAADDDDDDTDDAAAAARRLARRLGKQRADDPEDGDPPPARTHVAAPASLNASDDPYASTFRLPGCACRDPSNAQWGLTPGPG